MKLKYSIILVAFFSLFFSCEENEPTICGTENPLENLSFLKEAKNTIDRTDCAGKSTITQYTYHSETVFEINICNQIADGQTFIYNCQGEIICLFGGIAGQNTCPDFYKTATHKIILYGN